MTMKVVKEQGRVEIQPLTSGCQHNHSLAFADEQKRNSAFRQLAAEEVAKDYTVAAIATNITAKNRPKDRPLISAAGGAFFSLKDCHNAGAAYRRRHPDLRRLGAKYPWATQA